jgi:1-acyl-sn-glycerol-3-phosphate acyltransferase
MFRTVYVALVALVVTLIIAPTVTLISLFHSSSPLIDRLIRRWARVIVRSAGIELRGHNLDRLETTDRYVIIGNHASYLDIPCLLAVIPQPLRFMAKKSLFSIPIFGWGMKATGFIPVDRKNRSTAVQSFDLAAERIRKGNSIVIFPEEGRSRTPEMKPFQRGAFLLALRSGLRILPLGIHGTYDVMPATRNSIRPGRVWVNVGEPIDTSTFSIRQKDELIEATRSTVAALKEEAAQLDRDESSVEGPAPAADPTLNNSRKDA